MTVRFNVSVLLSLEDRSLFEEYRYSAFGEEEILYQKIRTNNPWRFCSKRKEFETNLIFFGRRFYDPEIGRWISPDPKGLTDCINLYAYVLNDPLHKIDLYGLEIGRDFPNFDNFNFHGDLIYNPTSVNLLTLNRPWLAPLFNLKDPSIHFLKPDERNCGIFFINGVNNSLHEALDNTRYISNLSGDENVGLIYNPGHGVATDLEECALGKCNIITAPVNALIEAWGNFIKANPDKDILQISHSQGTIHVKNALIRVTQEWRNKITVVNFAGASIIKNELCKEAFNYVSKADIIPFFAPERWNPQKVSNLFLLDRHKDAKGIIDHSFQSPTYREYLKYHIEEYLNSGRK